MIRSNKKINGHTLIEMIVAMAVFSLAVVLLSGSFSKIMSSYRRARNIQNNTEAAQQAINLMAKTFRTSDIAASTTLVANATQDIRVFDNSQSKCIRYFFPAGSNTIQYFEARNVADKAGCDAYTISNWNDTDPITGLTLESNLIGSANNVVSNGNFYIIRASAASPWKVTIRFDNCASTGCPDDEKIRMQTTVSLRQYAEMEYTEVEL